MPASRRNPTAGNRKLILTADDFGLSPALNAAVALAHKYGLLTCASLMVSAPAAAHAVALARQLPGLCLGLHLTLAQGRPVLPPRHVRRLVDFRGEFPKKPVTAGFRYYFKLSLLPEIRRELAAQIEAGLHSGLRLWFLNGHLNLHLHPRILPIVLDLAREYQIPAIRLCREDWRTTLALTSNRRLPKIAQGLIFSWLSARARVFADAAGLAYNDHLFGLTNDGRMTEAHLLALIRRLKPGVTEICFHPALYPDPELMRWGPGYHRQAELAALLSPQIPRLLAGKAVLQNFRDIASRDIVKD
uniref:ChbG/HpnK family deacetylase n=1 Tax=Desulfobacca acetoxidans TaxID=60893 RepID=A0A7C3WJ03_9BACT